MCLSLSLRSPALAVVGFCLVALATNCSAQSIIEGKAGEEYYRFTSLGIDSAGTVLIVGQDENGSATVFRLKGTDFELIRLGTPASGRDPEVTKISTDARYAIGTFGPEDGGDWWSQAFAQALRVHVTRIQELHEHAGSYYALTDAFDPGGRPNNQLGFHLSNVSITPKQRIGRVR